MFQDVSGSAVTDHDDLSQAPAGWVPKPFGFQEGFEATAALGGDAGAAGESSIECRYSYKRARKQL